MSQFIVRSLDTAHVEAAERRLQDGDPFVRLVDVNAPIGFPCRVTLAWAQPGEQVLLFRHRPFGPVSPYAEEGPIFARRSASQAQLSEGELPAYIAQVPHIAVRGYDETTSIATAEIAPGAECAAAIGRAFANNAVQYAHVRAGAYGCFQFRVDRAI